MDNFFNNILRDFNTAVPEAIRNSFNQLFPGALNTEWYVNGEIYEAVFHENDLEKIVFFDSNGTLIESKVNIKKTGLPENVLNTTNKLGEIMNVIEINSQNTISYEIILRDKNLIRYLYYFDVEGNILMHQQL